MEISKSNLEKVTAKRGPTEIDMVFMANEHLKANVGVAASENFMNDATIKAVKDSIPSMQRVIINRYFTNKLLVFRNNNDVDITEVIMMLPNDGEDQDWFTLFGKIVCPFLKNHNIM